MQGQTSEQTQVIIIPLVMVGFRFQTDDALLLLDVGWQRDHAYTSYRMIDDAINEKSDIRHEFAHPRGVEGEPAVTTLMSFHDDYRIYN